MMKKWIGGTLIACTVLSGATVALAAQNGTVQKVSVPYIYSKICAAYPQWAQICRKADLPSVSVPETEVPSNKPSSTETPSDTPSDTETPSAESTYLYAQAVLDLVNAERAANGLTALTLDTDLCAVALAHSTDMAQNNYFSHTNLQGQSSFDRIKAYGITYRTAAENIAAGQKTPQQVVESWMQSEGHRKNILNASFTKMGLGFASAQSGYGTYWTQLFIG